MWPRFRDVAMTQNAVIVVIQLPAIIATLLLLLKHYLSSG